MLFLRGRRQVGRTAITIATVGLVMVLAVGGWTWRNKSAMGKPIWATTHGGYTLLLGNNPSFYEYLAEAKVGEKWEAEFFHLRWGESGSTDPRDPASWAGETIDAAYVAAPLG